jgi:5-methylthioadenosine/S-adenosylhomocysteine deaminase
MATRDGAAALHLDHEIGTLEPGKAADVTVVDLRGWSLQPDGHPAARIVHGATAGDVRHVVVGGRPVVVDRQLETADSTELRQRIRHAWEATSARMGQAR